MYTSRYLASGKGSRLAPHYFSRHGLLRVQRAGSVPPAKARASSPQESEGIVKVAWTMQYRCQFGQNVSIVGGHKSLGDWNPGQGIALQWSEGDAWIGEAEIQLGSPMEYKYVVLGSGSNIVSWKPGTNYTLQELQEAPPGAKVLVLDTWDNSSRVVEVKTERLAPNDDKVAETPTSTAPGASDSARQPTEGQAGSPLSRIAGKSMVELQDALQLHEAVQQRAPDPASLEVIQADRLLAAANNKAVAFNKALKAANDFPELPSTSAL